jgi:hypothetical protein
MLGQNIPRLAFKSCCRGNKFRAVQDRAATHREQEIDSFALHHFDGLHECFIGGVGLDAAELAHSVPLQIGHHLVIDTVPFDAATTVGHEQPRGRRDHAAKLRDLALSEENLHRIEEFKVLHSSPL